MNKELKSCPFCGGKAESWKGMFGEHKVSCANDQCGVSLASGLWRTTKEAAIIDWNRRNETRQKEL